MGNTTFYYRQSADLKQRDGKEWREKLLSISDERARFFAASIVWWDYFGQRMGNEAWNHLDDIIEPKNYRALMEFPSSTKEVSDALFLIGYNRIDADTRARGPKIGKEINWGRPRNGARCLGTKLKRRLPYNSKKKKINEGEWKEKDVKKRWY